MTIKIKIEDYLNKEEIKDLVKEEVRSRIRKAVENDDFQRILSNASYGIVFKAVDEHFDGKLVDVIKEKTLECIEGISSFYIFRRKTDWQKEDSKGYIYLQEAIEKHKDILFNKVKEILLTVDEYAFMEKLLDAIFANLRREED